MGKDLKDLINTVEKETKSIAELGAIINSLNEEINRLNGIIDEQKKLINVQPGSIPLDVSNIPSEVDTLKELVASQRQELIKRDEINEQLHDQIDELMIKIGQTSEGVPLFERNEDLVEAKKLILKLTEENEKLFNEVEELKTENLESEDSEYLESDQEFIEDIEEIVNIKRLNFQLMEENGLLRVEVESLKSKLKEKVNEINSEELKLANNKIEALMVELEDYQAQNLYLQQKLETEIVPKEIQPYTTNEFNNLKEELKRYQNEIQKLKNNLFELEQKTTIPYEKEVYNTVVFNYPKHYQISLFNRMFKLLNETDKNIVVNSLIKDLESKNNDVKRVVLKILCEIKEEKVFKTFLELLHDKDWVIRFNVIKALNNFGFDSSVFKDSLKKLTKDTDIDVRELAVKVLEDLA
ncbi:MAG: HEAT repeat domain-containing protein [Candidatus Thorarchaeota archaeon]